MLLLSPAKEDAAEEELAFDEEEEAVLEWPEEDFPPEVQPLKAKSMANASDRASVFFAFMMEPP